MITNITRQDIMDILEEGIESGNFYYHGRLEEIEFFQRLYNLSSLPSTDDRSKYNTAFKDIWQHRVNNNDWEWDWFYQYYNDNFDLAANDDKFLLFLCEMFHPTVVNKKQTWPSQLESINDLLENDGVRIVKASSISGRAIYSYETIEKNTIIGLYSKGIKQKFDSKYINDQIQLMIENIEMHPNIAIGKSKELLESSSKTILGNMNIDYSKSIELVPLMKKVYTALELDVKSVDKNKKDAEIAIKILGSLTSITQHMAELRNAFGDGHGKDSAFKNLPSRYAELAVGTSTTIVNFIWKTYEAREKLNNL